MIYLDKKMLLETYTQEHFQKTHNADHFDIDRILQNNLMWFESMAVLNAFNVAYLERHAFRSSDRKWQDLSPEELAIQIDAEDIIQRTTWKIKNIIMPAIRRDQKGIKKLFELLLVAEQKLNVKYTCVNLLFKGASADKTTSIKIF